MNSIKIAFIVLVVGVAFSTALCHRQPAAKVQGRIEPIDLVAAKLENMRAFCANYYQWREDQVGGGLAEIDRLCFDAQEMMP